MKAGEGWLCFISPLLSQVNQLWIQIHPLRNHQVSQPLIEKYFNTIHGDLTLSFSEKGEVVKQLYHTIPSNIHHTLSEMRSDKYSFLHPLTCLQHSGLGSPMA